MDSDYIGGRKRCSSILPFRANYNRINGNTKGIYIILLASEGQSDYCSTVNDVIIRLISGGLTKSDKKGNHTAEMQDI